MAQSMDPDQDELKQVASADGSAKTSAPDPAAAKENADGSNKGLSKTSATDPAAEEEEENVAPEGYRIVSKLGDGASATVYKAIQLSTQRMVSIKLFNKFNQDLDIEHSRFRREATILSELQHPNIQKVLSYTFNRDNAPALISEYVDGKSLQEMLSVNKRLPADEFVEIFGTLVSAMAYLHNHKVLHRDLKPANLIIGATSSSSSAVSKCTLIDFGLAKLIPKANEAEKNKLTKTGFIVGTVNYLSPEQCEGKVADEKSEVFSLGIIMFESINGYPPWSGENAMHTMLLKRDSPPAAMRDDIPLAIKKLIERLLNKNPQLRPSMAELQSIFQNQQDIEKMTQTGKKSRMPLSVSMLTLLILTAVSILFFSSKSTKDISRPPQNHRFKEKSVIQQLQTASQIADRNFNENLTTAMRLQNLQRSDSILNDILSQQNMPKKYRYSAYCQLYSNAYYEINLSKGKGKGKTKTKEPLTFLQKAVECSKIQGQIAWDAFVAPILLGEYYEEQGHHQEALDHFEEAKVLIDKYEDYKENTKAPARSTALLILKLPEGVPGQMYHDANSYVKFKIAYLREWLRHDDTALKDLASERVIPSQYRIKTIYLIIDHEERTSNQQNSKWRDNLTQYIKECKSKELETDSFDLAQAFLHASTELFGRHNNHALAIDALLKASDIYPLNANLDQILVQITQGLKMAKDEHKPEHIIKELESALDRIQKSVEESKKGKSTSNILRVVPSL